MKTQWITVILFVCKRIKYVSSCTKDKLTTLLCTFTKESSTVYGIEKNNISYNILENKYIFNNYNYLFPYNYYYYLDSRR